MIRLTKAKDFFTALLLVGFLSASSLLVAEDYAADTDQPRSVWNVQVENDLFGDGFDRHYTNGVRINWVSEEKKLANWLHQLPGWAMSRLASCKDCSRRHSLVLGHSIFTPEDIETEALIEDDRPYAGWLYLGAGLLFEQDNGSDPARGEVRRKLDVLEVNLGIVGPSSLADDVQSQWHEWIDAPEPEGWDNQLEDEIGLVVYYNRQYQNIRPLFKAAAYDGNEISMDLMPHWGFALGNIHTYAAVGGTLRIGTHMAGDFGPPRIRPSLPSGGFFERNTRQLGWYAFVGVEGRAVAHSIFLDGNSFKDSHGVDKEHWVGDVQLGVVLTYDYLRISFTNVFRSKAFEEQSEANQFGAISLSLNF